MADLHVNLFGGVGLSQGGVTLPSGLPKKAKALIAYLANEPGKQVNREFLAEFLWPDRFDKQAQQSLRQALSAIRKSVGEDSDEFLLAGDGFLSIDRERVSTDVQDFEMRSASLDPEDMRLAVSLYQSDFLANLGAISPDFDHWAEQERSRLKALALPLFEHFVTSLESAGAVVEAIEAAGRLVEIDPAHEAGHRQLMRLYISQGQKSAAFRQFETCRRALAQLLDASPDAQTLALLEEVRAHSEEGVAPAVQQTSSMSSPPSTGIVEPSAKQAGDQPTPLVVSHLARRKGWVIGVGLAAVVLSLLLIWPDPLGRGTSKPTAVPDPVSAYEEEPLTCAALRPTAGGDQPVLLILPIRSFAENEFLNMFALSATDAILSMSSSISGVTFLAGPFLGHPDATLALRDLATKNSATHVFDTTIRPDTSGQRVTMRILEGATGRRIWQTVFTLDEIGSNPARVQNEIAIRAGRGIQEHLSDGSQALYFADIKPESLDLFEHNTRGFGYLSAIQPIYNDLARKEFEAVLKVDPTNPSANTGMGFHYISPILFRWPGVNLENLELAAAHAQASLDVTPDYAPARNLQAITLLFGGQHELALQKMEEGLRLSGSGADSTAFAGYILSFTDQTERSLEMAARAMRLRPYTSPLWYQWSFARSLRISGNLQGAITCLTEIDYQDQGVIAPAVELIQAYDEIGRGNESIPLVDLIMDRTNGSFSARGYCLAPVYQHEGMTKTCISSLRRAGLPE